MDYSASQSDTPRDAKQLASRGRQPLVGVAWVVVIGIGIDRQWGGIIEYAMGGYLLVALASLLLWGCLQRRRSGYSVAALALSLGALAAAWHHSDWYLFAHDDIGRFARRESEPVALRAFAVSTPTFLPAPALSPLRALPSGESTQLELRITGIRQGRHWRPAVGRARLRVQGHLLGVQAGDRLTVYGALSEPSEPQNPGEFNFADYARNERQLAVIQCNFPECVVRTEEGSPWHPRRGLGAVRRRLNQVFRDNLPAEQADIAQAMILGDRSRLSRDTKEAFLLTGLIHVLVVSGLHVGALVGAVFLLYRSGAISRRPALLMIALVVIGFALLTGMRPPVIRAMSLCLLACVGMMHARRGIRFNGLAAALIVVLLLDPSELFRPGTQLSFLAVGTLIWCGRWTIFLHTRTPQQRLLDHYRYWADRALRHAGRRLLVGFTGCFFIWWFAVPLVASMLHLVTPAAVLLSPIVIPLVGICVLSGFAALVADVLTPISPGLPLQILQKCLDVISVLIDWTERGNWVWWTAGPPGLWVLGWLVLLAALTTTGWERLPVARKGTVLMLWVAVGVWTIRPAEPHHDELICTAISLGHGTSLLLELPGGENLLYDCGSLGSPRAAADSISSVLWSRRISYLDGVILSHADVDHYNALPELAERFRIGAVYLAPAMLDPPLGEPNSEPIQLLLESIKDHRIPIREIWAGDRLDTGDGRVVLEIQHPPRDGILGSDNANSVVLKVEFAGNRILLPGDLESPGMEQLLEELPWDTDILLAPHHGSRHSDPPKFAQWARPEWVVISGRSPARTSSVAATYRDAGAQVVHTSQTGAARFILKRDFIELQTWSQKFCPD